MRVLDLGCGSGLDLFSWGVTSADEVRGSTSTERVWRLPADDFQTACISSEPLSACHSRLKVSIASFPRLLSLT